MFAGIYRFRDSAIPHIDGICVLMKVFLALLCHLMERTLK